MTRHEATINPSGGGALRSASREVELADVTRWHSHLHASPTAMMLVDNERRRVEVNTAACNLLGRSREQLLGMRLDELTPEDTRDHMETMWERFPHLGWQIGDLTLRGRDDRIIEVGYVAIANVLDGVHLIVLHSSRARACPERGPDNDRLTEHERRVISLVAMGVETREIAQRLNVSLEVVLGDLDRAMARLNARNQSHLVAIAVRRGLIDRA